MFEKEAKEYREEWQNKGYYFVSQEMEQIELDDIVDATFKDGAEFGYNKANEWHDLRKDPNDLPKKVGNYIVCFLDTACERHTFELSFVDYFEDKHWIDEDNHNIEGYDEGVIAWCEIPTFEG